MADTPKGPASCFSAIEKKSGQPVSHGLDIIAPTTLIKHMELVALLTLSTAWGVDTRARWSLTQRRGSGR